MGADEVLVPPRDKASTGRNGAERCTAVFLAPRRSKGTLQSATAVQPSTEGNQKKERIGGQPM